MRKERLPFVLLAMFSLIVGLLAGLQRIGWSFPLNVASSNHGAIMIGGFLGTLISLEKIIPLKRNWLYLIPGLSGSCVILFFFKQPAASLVCLLLASIGLSIVFLIYWIREKTLIYAMMFTGSLCWLTGNVVLINTGFYPLAVSWWIAFALLVISSERLELMRFLPVTTKQKNIFTGVLCFLLISCLLTFHGPGKFLAAFSLMAGAIWLMRFDVVGINLRKTGLTRYVGIALLSGYVALLITGILISSMTEKPLGYDIIVHSFFLGFVFSMIFAHGPIILPGVMGISTKPYHLIFYAWLVLLHTSWIIRAIADVSLDMDMRKLSGIISLIAILGYFISVVITLRRHRAQTF
jgi:hypothetical protein